MDLIILPLASFFTSTVSGTIGMAGGILLLSAMTFFVSAEIIVPIHGVVQLTSNSTRFLILRKYLIKNLVLFFSLGLPFGAIISTYLITKISNKEYFYLGISLIILFALFKPKKLKINIGDKGFFFIGLAVGFLGLFVGATGPFIAPFFLNERFNKEEIVANKACIQTLGHLIKIPAFLTIGFNYLNYSYLILLMMAGAIIGTKVGVKLLGKINQDLFEKFFKLALFLSAIRLLYKFYLSTF